MKLEIYNDLHLEFGKFKYTDDPESDLIIMAGDIATGCGGLQWIKNNIKNKPVIYVAGNHEFYNKDILATYKRLTKNVSQNIHFLQNDSCVIDGVEFIGATLWTDFSLYYRPLFAMDVAKLKINDYRSIYIGKGKNQKIYPNYILKEHNASLEYIKKTLSESITTKKVVVTHHAPSIKSIHVDFLNNILNPCYASNLEYLMYDYDITAWVHGHTHRSCDYTINNTRIVCNPRGYVGHKVNDQFCKKIIEI